VKVLRVTDLGSLGYLAALDLQRQQHAHVVETRPKQGPWPLLLVEHSPPVITVSRRAGARTHLTATDQTLARLGVEVCETDRGGDITWHGPGQLVAYPIVDLQRVGLGIHAYIRALERAVIAACAEWGLVCHVEPGVTGVWCGEPSRKICAIGVRVSRWVTMHGLALNVRPDLSHFDLIVPCGLHGRQVTSVWRELGERGPTMEEAKTTLAKAIESELGQGFRPNGADG
jgi:lipoate-protein ligase B